MSMADWAAARDADGRWPVPKTTEIVYTWPDGREEVRYRRDENSADALSMIQEVLELQRKHGDACPYSYRTV